MNIYTDYVFPDKLISPVNGYICKKITKQNIKQFGFSSKEELLAQYPDFPLWCENSLLIQQTRVVANIKKFSETINSKKTIKYNICTYCKNNTSNIKFCNRSCAAKYNNSVRSGTSRDKQRTTIIQTCRRQLVPVQLNFKESVCHTCNKRFLQIKNAKTCSKECQTNLLRYKSRTNPNCGGKRNHKKFYKKANIAGKEFKLESSYENKLADILNVLGILWIKPNNCLYYTDDSGNKRRYHPDFYLPDIGVYLDPKNDYLISLGLEKILKAEIENNVRILVLDKTKLTVDEVSNILKRLVEYVGFEPT